MNLQTYNYRLIISVENDTSSFCLPPGSLVRHKHHPDTMGTLVANCDDTVTVLWSTNAPRGVIYDPLDQMEDIFVPVRGHGGTPPMPQDEEEVSWVAKQIKRIFGKK